MIVEKKDIYFAQCETQKNRDFSQPKLFFLQSLAAEATSSSTVAKGMDLADSPELPQAKLIVVFLSSAIKIYWKALGKLFLLMTKSI